MYEPECLIDQKADKPDQQDPTENAVRLQIALCRNCSGGGRHRRRGVASERLSERIKEGAAL
ncbi:hypothetical protein, partial [Paraburkholderia mimosarum]